jgi:hypothetical protein
MKTKDERKLIKRLNAVTRSAIVSLPPMRSRIKWRGRSFVVVHMKCVFSVFT